MRTSFHDVRVAIVGCGAVSENLHLPALAAMGIRPALLVDPNLDRARELAGRYGAADVAADVAACAERADVAIVAVPISLHAATACTLLDAGVHVLVEKPLARDRAECDAIVESARRNGRVLGVGLMRRHLKANLWLHDLVASGALGHVESVDIREGYVFDWPVTSFGFFAPENGGVLKDLGAHTLDLVHWHFGAVNVLDYTDNAYGGVETDCVLEFDTDGGVRGTLELSRGRSLRNTFVVNAERATLELHHFGEFVHVAAAPGVKLPRAPRGDQELVDLFVAQHADFFEATRRGRAPLVPPADAAATVDVIEHCYANRTRMVLPWVESA